MIESNSPNYIFKFLSLRPAAPLREKPGLTIPLTANMARLTEAEPARRGELASDLLNNGVDLQDIDILHRINEAAADANTVGALREAVAELRGGAAEDYAKLSETVFAQFFGGVDAPELERGLALLHLAVGDIPDNLLTMCLEKARALPVIMADSRLPAAFGGEDDEEVCKEHAPDLAVLSRAVDELSALRESASFVSDGAASDDRNPGALNELGLAQISDATRRAVEAQGLSLGAPVHRLMSDIEAVTMSRANAVSAVAARPPTEARRAWVRAAGVGDLLVVKQHVKRYEASEIAHVENVMIGERRARVHRTLDRIEDVFITETEVTRETSEELQSTERHEMNREASKTIKRDQKLGLELSLSGKYGPTVEFSSTASMETSRAEEQSTRTSSTFAREVMSRSMEKIVERTREQRTLTILREVEETNEHSFHNESEEHVTGVYQFLEKVYANRIFNYGKRMMFDFMVPEPAHYIWHLNDSPDPNSEAPEPPKPLSEFASNAAGITIFNYRMIAGVYGAQGIEPPPPAEMSVYASYKYGEGGSESGTPRSTHTIEVDLPNGYRPVRVEGRVSALTDDDASFRFTAGNSFGGFIEESGATVGGGGHEFVTRGFAIDVNEHFNVSNSTKLAINVLAFESNNYGITLRVRCARSLRRLEQWQNETFDVIQRAYQDQLADYEQRLAQFKADAEQAAARADEDAAPFGDSPLNNRLRVLQELRKHCITLLTGQQYDAFGAIFPADPPRIILGQAIAQGSYIRFLEQAFEWDQMQYVLYPYYWADKDTWKRRFEHRGNDTLYQEFLRSGAARVVAPVRPGFERAVNYFLNTGALWNGEAEPPLIGEDLYVSIITEIEERTGRSKGELPVGEEWESRLPTNLVMLKENRDLPVWENADLEGWVWEPVA